jgi:hypothetical protein
MSMLATAEILPRRHAQTQGHFGRHFFAIYGATNTISAKIFAHHFETSLFFSFMRPAGAFRQITTYFNMLLLRHSHQTAITQS